jgi:hypothetical protein
LSSEKLEHPIWGSRPSSFPVLGPFSHAAGQRSCNDRLLYSSLCGQNLQLVLTILGGSASATEPTVRTTPPKVDKVGTSSVEARMTRALVARPGSKALDDNLVDDDSNLLNLIVVES